MHVRHEALFRWIDETFPGGKIYGPYTHGGRHYFQWMARGPFLRDTLLPVLERRLSASLDGHSWDRFLQMRQRYVRQLGPVSAPPPQAPPNGEGSERVVPPALSSDVEAIFRRLRQGAPGRSMPPA